MVSGADVARQVRARLLQPVRLVHTKRNDTYVEEDAAGGLQQLLGSHGVRAPSWRCPERLAALHGYFLPVEQSTEQQDTRQSRM